MKEQKTLTVEVDVEVYEFQIIREYRITVAEDISMVASSYEEDQDIIDEMVEDEKRFPDFEVTFPKNESSEGGCIMDIEYLGSHLEQIEKCED